MALRQLSSEAGAVRLCDLDPAGALTIECRPCNRHGRYRLETLIEAYGPKAGLPEIRRVVAGGGECRGRAMRVSRASITGAGHEAQATAGGAEMQDAK